MGDPRDLTIEIYDKKTSKLTTFSKLSVFVTTNLIILFKFMLYIFPWLEVWNGPRKACKLSFYQKNFKIVLCLVLFKIKVPKSELNIWVGMFDPCSSPPTHTEKCGGRIGAPDD